MEVMWCYPMNIMILSWFMRYKLICTSFERVYINCTNGCGKWKIKNKNLLMNGQIIEN